MRKITSVLLFLLLSTMSSMASTKIDLTAHPFNAWPSDCTVSGTTLTFTKAYGGAGCWLADDSGTYGGADYSNYDYLWVELNSCTCNFKLNTQYESSAKDDKGNYKIDESYDKSVLANSGSVIVGVALNEAHSDAFAQFSIQGYAIGSVDVKAAYVGTKEEYDAAVAANKPQKSDINLSSLPATGWEETTTYNDATKTVTIGLDWKGIGWWFGTADYSDFDYFVLNLASPTTSTIKCVVEYGDGTKNSGDAGLCDAGVTQVIIPLDATLKNTVRQVYMQGPAGSVYVLSSAYMCTANYLKTTGINSTTVNNSNASIVGTKYFDIAGQQRNGLQKGLNLVVKQLNNGNTVSEKILVK